MPETTPAILCQGCGLEAPTRHVQYHQNIGALVVRFGRTYKGHMCKNCNQKYFAKGTLTTLFLGPWGMISLVMTPFILIGNTITFLRSLSLAPVPPGATAPKLDEQAINNLAPHIHTITARLATTADPNTTAREIAAQANVTPGQALLYIIALHQRRAMTPQPPTHGFPVQPVPPPLPAQSQTT